MSLKAYKLSRKKSSSNPRHEMLREKRRQVSSLYDFAMDREDGCKLNDRDFVKSPRVFEQKIRTNYFQTLTMETIEKEDYFYSGDLLEYDNSFWICTSSFVFHKLYCKGNYIKCNYKLKWQNTDGEIIERYCLVQSAAQYNSGETGNKTFVLGSDQMMVVLPKDNETIMLDTPTSFFIDWNRKYPTAYKITRNDTVPYSDWEHGCINLIVTQRVTTENDNLELGICDYNTSISSPILPNPDETIISTVSGNTNLKVGYARSYTVSFVDDVGNSLDNVEFTWNIISDFNDKITKDAFENKIKLCVNDNSLINKSFLLQIIINGSVNSEITINVVSIF